MAATSPDGKRVALIIGNARYSYGPSLANPHFDSDAIARAFRRLDFTIVSHYKDLPLIELNRVLSDFGLQAEGAEIAAVYFAGHGMEVDGQNYLVPVDAELKHVRRVPFEAVPLTNVMAVVSGARRLPLVILDACRDNPFLGRLGGVEATRSIAHGLARVEPAGNTYVLYAAKHGTRALDGPLDKNSPFAEGLLDHLETGDLDIRFVFARVRSTVLANTNGQQEPFPYGEPGTEEIFLKRSQAQARNKQPHNDAEARWKEFGLDQSEDVGLIEAFLAQYGEAVPFLAELARRRLREIEGDRRRQDESSWHAARARHTIAAYERYLAEWPDGAFAREAADFQKDLRDTEAWQRADATGSAADLRRYLEDWPEGGHRSEALRRLAQIAEGSMWEDAKARNTIQAYEDFLQTWPKGRWTMEADGRLSELTAEAQRREAAQHSSDAGSAASGDQNPQAGTVAPELAGRSPEIGEGAQEGSRETGGTLPVRRRIEKWWTLAARRHRILWSTVTGVMVVIAGSLLLVELPPWQENQIAGSRAEAQRTQQETETMQLAMAQRAQEEAARQRAAAQRAQEEEAARQRAAAQQAETAAKQQADEALLAAATRSRIVGSNWKDCRSCPQMVTLAPKQAFEMGTKPEEAVREDLPDKIFLNEQVPHPVDIETFAIGKYPVTRSEYGAYIAATGAGGEVSGCILGMNSKPDPSKSWRDPGFTQTDVDPVVCVSWDDANKYVAWLSKTTGKSYRLPSEAEWEYAARAGSKTARYWGDPIDSEHPHANCDGCGSRRGNKGTSPVDRFAANRFGLHDMLGNAQQWLADCWTSDYTHGLQGIAVGETDCSERVWRGGSWLALPRIVRAGYRSHSFPGTRYNYIGFRVARTP